MYKLLLCWRYLLTRYLAMACIISVMLGVATLIVVNSVMSGFSTKLKQRLHGLLSDVLVESMAQNGFSDPEHQMDRIRNSPIGSKIEAMTPTIEVLGLIQITYNYQQMPPRPVRLIAIDPKGRALVGGFSEFLQNPANRKNPSFDMDADTRRRHTEFYPPVRFLPVTTQSPRPGDPPPPVFPVPEPKAPDGVILGYSIGNFRRHTTPGEPPSDLTVVRPGDEVVLYTISAVEDRLAPVYDSVVVTDYFKSEMSEYDANYIFVPLEWMQRIRGMENRATTIQIKLKDYGDAPEVVKTLQDLFPEAASFHVETWEDKQGPLLAAIAIERGILNVLLFLIVCVAGFGILAIFAMIVVEKTRDIGILKALGASNGGVMKIFLGYGLLLGVIGAGLGTGLGVALTMNINDIEHFLGQLTGHDIFPRDVYYFDKIPTNIQSLTILFIDAGAVAVAVLASVLPALRAALLHPVRALRYE